MTLMQMTVVEAYVGKNKMDPPEDGSQLPTSVSSLLDEGLAQNTTGSVFLAKVLFLNVRVLLLWMIFLYFPPKKAHCCMLFTSSR